MKIDCFKMADIQKVIFLISFFVFLFFGLQVFADRCSLSDWNKAGTCTLKIHYRDLGEGSGLDKCEWKAGSTSTMPSNCSDVISWDSACDCKNQTDTICHIPVSIRSDGNCNTNGVDACKICFKATDNAGNIGYAGTSLDIDYTAPTTIIECDGTTCLAGWYATNTSITLSCSDFHSGCTTTYYCIDQTKSCNPDPTEGGNEYAGAFELTAEGTNYVIYYSTDIAGNVEPTDFKTIKLDKTRPKSEFTDVATPPAGSTVTSTFDVSVNDWDRPTDVDNSGLAGCYYSIHDSGADWLEKSGETRYCNSNLSFTVIVNPGGDSGDCRTIGGICTVSVYAYDTAGNSGEGQFRTFNIAALTHTLNISSTSGGSVTDPGEGIFTYNEGDVISLLAAPDSGYHFVNWTGDTGAIADPNSVSTTITMNSDYSITANFEKDNDPARCEINVSKISVNVDETFTITVEGWDEDVIYYLYYREESEESWTGESCGAIYCSEDWPRSESNPGIYHYYGGIVGYLPDGNFEELKTCGPVEVTVSEITHTLNISSTLGGSVTDPGEGIFTYNEGDVVSLLAAPDSGYHFVNWTGDIGAIADSDSSSTTITMNSDYSITANFEVVNLSPQLDSISVSPDYVKQGDTITINSIASDPNDGDNIRLECGSSTESNDLCIGNYVATNPSCTSSSPWIDDTTHTIYCRAYDGELYSEERTDTIISDNTGPIIGEISPTEAVKDQSQIYTFPVSDACGADSCVLQYVDGEIEGLDITLSDIPCQDCLASFSYTFFETGTHTFQVMCDDLVDNATIRIFDIEVSEFGLLICDINVPDTGIINQWIEINVSGSQGAIVGVRFSSNLIGEPTGIWTEGWFSWSESCPYDENCSSNFNCPTCNKYGGWDHANKTMKWRFAETGNYEVWAEVKDGSGLTDSDYDTITIFECWPDWETRPCSSSYGCEHIQTCTSEGTWPTVCGLADECTPGGEPKTCWVDGTEGIQTCTDFCIWGPCIFPPPPECPWPPDITCDICWKAVCGAETGYIWECQPDSEQIGDICGDCKLCDDTGNCVYQCWEGPQDECECIPELGIDNWCIDCLNYYDPGGPTCGSLGIICSCGPCERHIWSCVDGQCVCDCSPYDETCPGCAPDGCQRDNPGVVLSPAFKSGNAGVTLTYDISVSNNDLNCDDSTFTLTTGEICSQTDWTCLFQPGDLITTSLTIPAGQSDNSLDLVVESPSNAPKGDKYILVTAYDSVLDRSGYGSAIYRVLNNPPSAKSLSVNTEVVCPPPATYPFVSLSWVFDDIDGDSQSAYRVEIFDESDNLVSRSCDPDLNNPDARCETFSSSYSPTPPDIPLSFNTIYYWKVKVWDSEGDSSEDWIDGPSFTTPLHAAPWPDFEPSPTRVHLNEVVTFEDHSTCYVAPGNNDVSCDFPGSTFYEWDFDYDIGTGEFTVDSNTKGSPTKKYNELGKYYVKLRITDTVWPSGETVTCDSDTKEVTVTRPLPEWMEIPPF